MGRPRKPVEEHKAAGTFRRDRHTDADRAARFFGEAARPPSQPPAKPTELEGTAGDFWDHVVRLLAGVVTARDGPQLVQLCRWWARWKEAEDALANATPGTTEHARLIKAASTCSANFDRIARRFGLTPADRIGLPQANTTGARIW